MSGAHVVGRRQLASLREELTDRDLAIVRQVADLRLMSARQLETAHFPIGRHATALTAARTCRRVLERLVRLRLLCRLVRRVGGVRAGSASFVYALGPVGHRLLELEGPRRRFREPGAGFVDHCLAVSQFVVDCHAAAGSGAIEVIEVQPEPTCWRTYLGVAGRQTVRPDLFVAVAVDDLEYRWFVEIDRGTEHLPAIVRQARAYLA